MKVVTRWPKDSSDYGVLVAGTLINVRVIRIEPPLTITKAELDRVLETLGKVFGKASKSFG